MPPNSVHTMNQALTMTLAVLGILLLALVLAATGVYLYRNLLAGDGSEPTSSITFEELPMRTNTTTATPAADISFTFSDDQIRAVTALGIDPDSLPRTITGTQRECFSEALGSARVEEIRTGAVPGPLELVKVKGCF